MQPAMLVKTAVEGLDDGDIQDVHKFILSLAANRGIDLSDERHSQGDAAMATGHLLPASLGAAGTAASATPVPFSVPKRPSTWAKRVDKVDWSKKGGYAIEGPFIDRRKGTAGLTPGTLVVVCKNDGLGKRYGLFEIDPTVASVAWEGGSLAGVKLLAATGIKGGLSVPPGVPEPDGFGDMQEVAVELKARGM